MVGKLHEGVSGPGNKSLQVGKTFFSKWTVKVEACTTWCQCLWTQLKRWGELYEKMCIEETGQLPLIVLKKLKLSEEQQQQQLVGKLRKWFNLTATVFRSGIASPVDNDYQQSTNSSINKVWGPWRASVNKRRGNPIHPGSYLWPHVLLYIIAKLLAFWTFLSKLWS